ncbi:phage tail tape measure protein [Streptomyces sp. NPDC051320]|uniref:phage tail tape measure protein n=1 Tax=Streptomyces sp. NPDC051320 TaxID=3154644 RepID=UPI0034475BC3
MASDTSLVFNLVARDRASEQLGSMKEKFSAAGTAIGAALGVGLGASFVSSMDVEAANDKLAAQLGVGQAEAANLAKVSANVYKDAWGESTEDVNDAIRGVYQNIGDTSKAQGGLQGVTEKVIALRDTFDQDLGGVTAAVGQMMKTGLAKNADEAMDIVTAGFQKGVNKADDFLDTLNEYGVQFHSLGLNGQQATGLLSQGLKGGASNADLVADSLKEFGIRARDINSTAPAGFKAIGLNAKQMAADVAAGGPKATAALQKTLDALRKYPNNSKKAGIAAALFGTQSEDMQKALMSLDPAHAVQSLGKVSGAADRMAKTVGDNPKAALESFQRSAEVATTQAAGKFINFAMKNQAIFKPLAGILAGVAVAVLAVSAAQKVYAAYTAVASAAQTIWNAEIWASTAALLANPMTWIVIGIIALIAVIVLIATKTQWFQQLWTIVWGAIKTAALAVWAFLKTAFTTYINFYLTLWNTVSGALKAAWTATWNALKTAASAVWGAIKAVVMLQINAVKTVITTVMNGIKAVVSKVWSWIKSFIGIQVTAVRMAISKLSAIAGQVGGYFQHMKDAAVGKVSSLISFVRGIGGKVRGAIGNLGGLLKGVGRSIIQGLINGVTGMIGSLKQRFSSITNMIPDWKGPMTLDLKLLTPSGQALMGGLMTGIDSQLPALHAQLTGVTKSVTDDVKPTVAGLTPANIAPPTATSGQAPVRVVIDVTGAEGPFKTFIQSMVRVDGQGSVQKTFGQGRAVA